MVFSGFCPPSPLHAVRWERRLLRGCPLLFLLVQGVTLLPLWHAMRWERTLPFRGVPPFIRAWPARRGERGPYPSPSFLLVVCARFWAWGAPSSSWSLPQGGPVLV